MLKNIFLGLGGFLINNLLMVIVMPENLKREQLMELVLIHTKMEMFIRANRKTVQGQKA